MPNLKGKILFLEEDSLTGKSTLKTLDRYLHSLMQQPNFEHITGIVIGRMQKSRMYDSGHSRNDCFKT